jgi:protease I
MTLLERLMKHLILSLFSLLLFLPGCGKKTVQTIITQPQATKSLYKLPAVLYKNLCVEKKCIPPKSCSTYQQARDLLQLAFGLRDAARGKIHKIPVLANGSLFNVGGIRTRLELSTTTSKNDVFLTTLQNSTCEQNTATYRILSHAIESNDMQIQTTLKLTPAVQGEKFCNQLLDEAFDTLESGYASNEIGLTLSGVTHTTKLCWHGCDMAMSIALEPTAITYQCIGYGLDPRQYLTTIIDIPSAPMSEQKKETSMKKNVLFILMPRDFQDFEFTEPHNALVEAGCNVDVAGLSSGDCIGSAGTKVTPTKLLSSMTLSDFNKYHAILITGGFGSPKFLWNNEDIQAVVRYFHEEKKLVATICYASIVPVQAGILHNLTATVYPTDRAKKIFADNQVIFTDQLCVELEKERIITAQSPEAIKPFVAALLKYLAPPLTLKEALHG